MVLKGIVLILLAAAAWGMGGVSGQYMFAYHHVDAVWLVMVRQLIAGCIFLAWSAARGEALLPLLREHPRKILLFSFGGILGAQLGFYYTISLCNAATATVLQYMAPVYVMLWVAFKRRCLPEGRELAGIVLALAGVFLISTHGSLDSLALSPAALLIGILSAVSYAYYSVAPVEMLKKYSTTVVIGWGQLLSGAFLLLFRDPLTPAGDWTPLACAAFAYLVLGATVFSYALYLSGLKIVGSLKASLISCAEPLSSIISVVLLLGTVLTAEDYIGMGCIILTVLLLSVPKK